MTDIKKERKRAPGAGRKKGEDTKLKRIPVSLELAIDGLITLYKYNEDKWPFLLSGQTDKALELSELTGIPACVILAYQVTNRDTDVNARKIRLSFSESNKQYELDAVFDSVKIKPVNNNKKGY